jgi:hypothetical protein
VPYEQKTQQSPTFGLTTCPQDGQSQKYTHAVVGICSTATFPQWGHRSDDVSITGVTESRQD